LTAEQLEAARAERMRQNGHGAISIEDVRTWIEETGLCIFLPRSTQGGQPILSTPTATPTFVEAVAGQRTNQPTLELIQTAESLLVRLEADGVAVRLNLAGQPGENPDYVVAGWVLPYIYALRGDRDWRRSPQLTGSRQVSQLAVHAAKHLDTANLTATQIRDALGKEVTEVAVLRALHELWKQLRIIPVVPEIGAPALWQPLRQRFQKAIAEGASTSQVTAISVLASIYLQAVIAASMEDIEMFLSPLTSRSKIREVVRGLAATRQVHSTSMGQSQMFYVAGTLPEFAPVPSYEISSSPAYRSSNYRSSTYLATYLRAAEEEELAAPAAHAAREIGEVRPAMNHVAALAAETTAPGPVDHVHAAAKPAAPAITSRPRKPLARPSTGSPSFRKAQSSGKTPSAGKSAAPRPRAARSSGAARPSHTRDAHARDRGHAATSSGARPAQTASNGSNGNGNKLNGNHRNGSNGNGSNGHRAAHSPVNGAKHSNGTTNIHKGNGAKPASASKPGNGLWKAKSHSAKPVGNSNGVRSKLTTSKQGARPVSNRNGNSGNGNSRNGASSHAVSTRKAAPVARNGKSLAQKPAPRPAPRSDSRSRVDAKPVRKPVSASGRTAKPLVKTGVKAVAKAGVKSGAKTAVKAKGKPVASVAGHRQARPMAAKRRG
jgi:23S rRNA pseudouridine2605 synthase